MRYRVQAGRSGAEYIEVYQGNALIVRVRGKIGYNAVPGEAPYTKFKIGHYRDFMPTMDIDWIRVR